MVAPVIMAFGNRAQQEHFLPRILSGEHWWCQSYSEPGAGSDLASLTTRAERRGSVYVANGQKTWNTLGHFANWIFCLVRTDSQSRPQAGISFLLIDMRARHHGPSHCSP
jgi:alkylation response protein AidB-like acyl-CoA dehydrogenase